MFDLALLDSGWALWLVPAVIVCFLVAVYAIHGELGLRNAKKQPPKAAPAQEIAPVAEGELPVEVILAAAAAYCCGEDNIEI